MVMSQSRQPVGDPGHLTERYDVTMACGRRIHGWLHKDGAVAAVAGPGGCCLRICSHHHPVTNVRRLVGSHTQYMPLP